MPTPAGRLPAIVAAVALIALAAPAAPRANAAPQVSDPFLDFCLANADRCALSIVHLTGGWERHVNADRLQSTASTYKIFMLLAYADAVSRGEVDPDQLITREQWARYWAGFDGGSFATAYARLGAPLAVRLDDLVGAMIRESDNNTPDLLLSLLGAQAVERAIKRWVPGFHDVPLSINAIFATFDNHPLEPLVGHRVIEDYRGFESAGYRAEVDAAFAGMHSPAFVDAIRLARCAYPPWQVPPAGCVPDFHNTAAIWQELNNRFFVRATTRSYAEVMRGILEGNLFPPRMQEVVARHLEYFLGLPAYAQLFSRYGAKGGSLGPNGVLNWATFLESAATGDQVAVSMQVRFVNGGIGTGVAMAERLALDRDFAEAVRAMLPADPRLPELTAWTERIALDAPGKGKTIDVRADVLNASPFAVHAESEVHLYLSDDSTWDAGDLLLATARTPSIPAYGRRQVRLTSDASVGALPRFVLVVVDATGAVAESDEANNVVWERVGG